MAIKISNEARLGIMALITLTLMIWGIMFLKGKNMLDNSSTYFVTYNDVDGLTSSAPVLVNGFQIGTVTDVSLKPDDVEKILVKIEVDGDIKIPNSAVAILATTGIMGSKAIILDYDNEDMVNDILPKKSFIPSSTQGLLNSMVDANEMDIYFEKLKTNIDGLIDTFSTAGNENAEQSLMQSVEEFQATIKNLSGISNKLNLMLARSYSNFDQTLANVAELSETLKASNYKIDNIITNLDEVSTDLKNAEIDKTVKAAEGAITEVKTSLTTIQGTVTSVEDAVVNINKIIDKVESGEGSLSALLNDEGLYNNLESTSKNLDLLLQDLRLNPKRYINVSVFGKKQLEFTLPEDDPAKQGQH